MHGRAVQDDACAITVEQSEPSDLASAKGQRFPDMRWPPLRLLDLKANGQIPSQESEPDGNAIGMEAVADQMIEVMPIFEFFNRLFGSPALAIRDCQPVGTGRA